MVNIKEVDLLPKAKKSVTSLQQQSKMCFILFLNFFFWTSFLGVVKIKHLSLPQVSSQHRFKHFSFQDSQEPPPSVSISPQPQAKVIILNKLFYLQQMCDINLCLVRSNVCS